VNGISQLSLCKKPENDHRPSISELSESLRRAFASVEALVSEWADRGDAVAFKDFELALRSVVMALARAAVCLFLEQREDRVVARVGTQGVASGRRFRRAPARARNLMTLFGVIRYWRTYMREVSNSPRRGYHPLDVSLGLTADRVSWNVLSMAALFATKLSFAQARSCLMPFLPVVPSTEVIEQTVLGLGHHTEDWFASAPPPEADGEVLVIMVDSKGAPTATEQELERRRGKRKQMAPAWARSPRHRSRQRRSRHPKKARPAKGDKSKNAKMATMVVLYTLRREGELLVGPINRWTYASFAPKKRAFVVALREAEKRGFSAASGKRIQVVTDGDDDLARYTAEYFPEALHTIDIIHVVEKLWDAGLCLYPEGSEELRQWVAENRERLYGGAAPVVVYHLQKSMNAIPKTGPGNKNRRERLASVIRYISKRYDKMRYHQLAAEDLEVSTGLIEGAIKNIIGRRCDQGGMRWIKERAESVLQLRCIEANGDWDAFCSFVHDRLQAKGQHQGLRVRLQTQNPASLPPAFEVAA